MNYRVLDLLVIYSTMEMETCCNRMVFSFSSPTGYFKGVDQNQSNEGRSTNKSNQWIG